LEGPSLQVLQARPPLLDISIVPLRSCSLRVRRSGSVAWCRQRSQPLLRTCLQEYLATPDLVYQAVVDRALTEPIRCALRGPRAARPRSPPPQALGGA